MTCPDCKHYDPGSPAKVVVPACPGDGPEEDGDGVDDGGVNAGILIVKLAATGDVLRTTALLPAIRKRYAGARVTWLTHPDAAALFLGNDLVDEVWPTDMSGLLARLRAREFDVVLCPDADPQTVALAAAANGRGRQGFTVDDRGAIVPLNDDAEHWLRMGISDPLKKSNTETYQNLVARALDLDPGCVGRPILRPAADDRSFAARLLADHGLTAPIVGLNTGASPRWRHKRWTRGHQAEFVAAMTDRSISVLLLGGGEEARTHAELRQRSAGAKVVSAGTDLSYGCFAACVESCQALVTGDTLALHVATARKVPVVALFGPTSATEIELYERGVKVQPDGLPCLVCYLPDCDVEPHCQELITVDRVVAAVAKLLS
ncbi:MAG: glycosyltransferase family 9 protein [Planctomycetota bacterium]